VAPFITVCAALPHVSCVLECGLVVHVASLKLGNTSSVRSAAVNCLFWRNCYFVYGVNSVCIFIAICMIRNFKSNLCVNGDRPSRICAYEKGATPSGLHVEVNTDSIHPPSTQSLLLTCYTRFSYIFLFHLCQRNVVIKGHVEAILNGLSCLLWKSVGKVELLRIIL
jgi:hypothetical protein